MPNKPTLDENYIPDIDIEYYPEVYTGIRDTRSIPGYYNTAHNGHVVTGTNLVDTLLTYNGDDLILGGAGNDTLRSSEGDDIIVGGDGNDDISGGDGDDWLYGDEFEESGIATGIDTIYGEDGNDYIFGGSGRDLLRGDNGDDIIDGGEGNDDIDGGSGFDTVSYVTHSVVDMTLSSDTLTSIERVIGSHGNDILISASNIRTFDGGDGDDIIIGGSGYDRIYGGNGDDILDGGVGADMLDGGDGFDVVNYSERSSLNMETEGDTLISIEGILGSSGDDTMLGGTEVQEFNGGAGSNTISYKNDTTGVTINLGAQTVSGGHAEGDIISNFSNATGGSGDDTIIASSESNTLSGGAGDNDFIAYVDDIVGVDINLETQTVGTANNGAVNALAISHAEGDVISGFEHALGGNGDDVLAGSADNNFLLGLDGGDIIFGGAGIDIIDGGEGNDIIDGGVDIDSISGGEGNDYIIGRADGSVLDGGEGFDTLDYSASDERFHIDLGLEDKTEMSVWYRETGQVSSSGNLREEETGVPRRTDDYDIISGFEHVFLGSGNDYIEGSGTADNAIVNVISGGSGNDNIYGKYGDDILFGDAGQDIIRAGQGSDLVYGGDDLDVLLGHDGNDIMFGDAGNDKMWGNNDDDTLYGNTGNDEIYGGRGIDTLYGNEDNDTLSGYDGDDTLYGGTGNDYLYGQKGADTFYGGEGQDRMFAGGSDGSQDRFIFETISDSYSLEDSYEGKRAEWDRIVDFEIGTDEINLAALGAQSASVISSSLGANVYEVTVSDNADFGIVVTTTGGTLSAGDIIV